jgi:hypothetical protein
MRRYFFIRIFSLGRSLSARGCRLSKIETMTADSSQALEPFRSYLEVLARVHLDPRLRGKFDPADGVQQTLLRAYTAWPTLKNPDRPVLLAPSRRGSGRRRTPHA